MDLTPGPAEDQERSDEMERLRQLVRKAVSSLGPCPHWVAVGGTRTCTNCIADAAVVALFRDQERSSEWDAECCPGEPGFDDPRGTHSKGCPAYQQNLRAIDEHWRPKKEQP